MLLSQSPGAAWHAPALVPAVVDAAALTPGRGMPRPYVGTGCRECPCVGTVCRGCCHVNPRARHGMHLCWYRLSWMLLRQSPGAAWHVPVLVPAVVDAPASIPGRGMACTCTGTGCRGCCCVNPRARHGMHLRWYRLSWMLLRQSPGAACHAPTLVPAVVNAPALVRAVVDAAALISSLFVGVRHA
ncbi:hypothetical protein [Erwinia sorbitola]|uniref:Uncharacterized protein n=1 Tax=Erwinia sorbitola TaxID=2681984 RepID=A0ABW9R9R8_9GAMM|nr:hypothetical protein [Erwinia sorbitola]MTD26751.1 hypothetical protein [Erwinia sorbitola]